MASCYRNDVKKKKMAENDLGVLEPNLSPLARELLAALIDMFRSAFAEIAQINIIGMFWRGKKAVVDAHSILLGSVLKGVPRQPIGFEHLRDRLDPAPPWRLSGGISEASRGQPYDDNLPTRRERMALCHVAHIEVVVALAAANPIPESDGAVRRHGRVRRARSPRARFRHAILGDLRKATVLRLELSFPDGKPPVLLSQPVVGRGSPQRADLDNFLFRPKGLALDTDNTLYVTDGLDTMITAIPDAWLPMTNSCNGHSPRLGRRNATF